MQFRDPLAALRYHVSGAIERGEKEPIRAKETPDNELPRNWRRWSTQRIEALIVDYNASQDESVESLIDELQDELDKRDEEEEYRTHWYAREGERPYWA